MSILNFGGFQWVKLIIRIKQLLWMGFQYKSRCSKNSHFVFHILIPQGLRWQAFSSPEKIWQEMVWISFGCHTQSCDSPMIYYKYDFLNCFSSYFIGTKVRVHSIFKSKNKWSKQRQNLFTLKSRFRCVSHNISEHLPSIVFMRASSEFSYM